LRKLLLWTGITVVALLLVVALSTPGPDETASDSEGASSSPPQATSAPPAQPEPDRIDLAGRGDYASDNITLETGLALFVMTHTGQANFIVELLGRDGQMVALLANDIGGYEGSVPQGGQANFIVELLGRDGQMVALLANDIGGYEGSVPQGVTEGEYVLSIQADGDWNLSILQPRPSSGTLPPLEQEGTGDYFIGPVQLSQGLARFELSHDGHANFIVTLMNRDGEWVDLLANEIGSYSGSKAVRVPYAGVYWLGIEADGAWTATVTQ